MDVPCTDISSWPFRASSASVVEPFNFYWHGVTSNCMMNLIAATLIILLAGSDAVVGDNPDAQKGGTRRSFFHCLQ
jgi:hypothetical protein